MDNYQFMNVKKFPLSIALLLSIISTPSFSSDYKRGDLICTGTVTHVSDGDTVKVVCNGETINVRVAEIDTPETKKRNKSCYSQPLGLQAKDYAVNLLQGNNVDVLFFDEDRWGRTVAKLEIGGKRYSYFLVENGYAHVYKRYARDPKLAQLESLAKQNSKGVWSLPKPCQMLPGDWRNKLSKEQRCALQQEWKALGCY